jgi:hypothetical protein
MKHLTFDIFHFNFDIMLAQYLYDAGGNRVKKIVRTQGGDYEVINMLDEYEAEIEKIHDAYLSDLFDKLQSGEIQASDLTAEEFWEVMAANEDLVLKFGPIKKGDFEYISAVYSKDESGKALITVKYKRHFFSNTSGRYQPTNNPSVLSRHLPIFKN